MTSGPAVNGPTKCARCGKDPADGFAMLNDDRFCHGDDNWQPGDPWSAKATCYELAQHRGDWFGALS